MFDHDVWDRKGKASTIGQLDYVLAISVSFAIALVIFYTSAKYFSTILAGSDSTWTIVLALIVGFVGMLLSSAMFTASNNPAVSGLGVASLAASAGLLCSPTFLTVPAETITFAAITTTCIFTSLSVVSIVASLFGKLNTDSWGLPLMQLLGGLIVFQIINIVLGSLTIIPPAIFSSGVGFMSWVTIILFTFYIVYDWNQALKIDLTFDNAIDASGALLLDWLNIFLAIVNIKSK